LLWLFVSWLWTLVSWCFRWDRWGRSRVGFFPSLLYPFFLIFFSWPRDMAGSTLASLYDASLDVLTSVRVWTYRRKTLVLVLDTRVVAANSAALSLRIHFVRGWARDHRTQENVLEKCWAQRASRVVDLGFRVWTFNFSLCDRWRAVSLYACSFSLAFDVEPSMVSVFLLCDSLWLMAFFSLS
jgi:hypothetical protein